MKPPHIAAYREAARRRVPRFLFDYLEGGAGGEATLRANIDDLQQVFLRQRVLAGTGSIDLSTDIFGTSWRIPVALAPVGMAGMYARRGETQAVRAAGSFGVPFTLSTVSLCSIAEVAAAAPAPFWFQLYLTRDRGYMRELLAAAREAGCSALVYTVDMPVPGTRHRDAGAGLASPGAAASILRILQAIARPAWAWDVGLNGRPHRFGNLTAALQGRQGLGDYFTWIRGNFDPSACWSDLEAVRAEWSGPLILKGVLDVEDARRAAMLGADGIGVSNHGGRQLDGALSTARALPAIADAVGDDLTILADGGIRTGTDIVRMLALGARGVLLGRAWIYALASGGEAEVARMLAMLEAEMRTAMALTGHRSVGEVTRASLAV